MHCKQIARQTKGEIQDIELDGLCCSRAGMCRRKGICALSPFSRPELVTENLENPAAMVGSSDSDHLLSTAYEVLEFKYSLGFHWVKMKNFQEAVRTVDNQLPDEHPRVIRRVEYFQLPD